MTANSKKTETCVRSVRSAAAALLVLAGAGLLPGSADPALAQASPARRSPLVVGTPVSGEIVTSDPMDENGQRYHDYLLRLRRGERVRIDMDAVDPTPAFDTYLMLRSADGSEGLRYNDDRGDGTLNSSVMFEAPDDGVYLVRAQAFAGSVGAYRLSVSSLEAPPAPERIVDGTFTGSFGPRSPIMDATGRLRRYVEYLFHADPGSRVQIDFHGGGRDRWAQLYDVDGVIMEDLESLGGSDSRDPQIFAIPRHSGDYRLRIQTTAQTSADYTIELKTVASPTSEQAPERLLRGVDTRGALTIASPAQAYLNLPSQIAYFYRDYSVRVSQGEALTITLSTPPDSFQPRLEAGGLTPIGFAVSDYVEDVRGPVVLRIRPERSGILGLRVRSLGTGRTIGPFTLRVDPTAPAPPAANAGNATR